MLAIVLHALGFPAALAIANASEWFMHKYVLHGLGRRKSSFWAFHWYAHHNAARRNEMYDVEYEHPLSVWNGQTKELAALVAGVLAIGPLWWYVPGLAAGLLYSACNYYYKHKRSHLDLEYARKHLPWHYDHHMGADQDANWCVTRPWFDWVMGTRVPYLGTPKEEADRTRRAARGPLAERSKIREERSEWAEDQL